MVRVPCQHFVEMSILIDTHRAPSKINAKIVEKLIIRDNKSEMYRPHGNVQSHGKDQPNRLKQKNLNI